MLKYSKRKIEILNIETAHLAIEISHLYLQEPSGVRGVRIRMYLNNNNFTEI